MLHDAYFKRAKAEGYVARSAYKLLEIQERRRLMRAGDLVLDLGCAPGSWVQVASRIVGARGRMLGVDLQPADRGVGAANVRTEVGDVFGVGAGQLMEWNLGDRFDVVLSDMAPSTSGAGPTDHFRSIGLCQLVLALCPGVLRGGGSLAMKVFEGEAYQDLLGETRALFREVRGLKPKATRDVSREMYVLATGFTGAVDTVAAESAGGGS